MDSYGGYYLKKELMSQILKVSGLNKFVCELENEVNQIKTFLMKSSTNSISCSIYPKPGYLTNTLLGEGFLLQKCRKINDFKLFLTRELLVNGKKECYNDIPVRIGKIISFLDIPSKQIKKIEQPRNCS